MMVVSENFRDAEFAADVHWNTISQTITFVETRFVKFEGFEKSRFSSRNNLNSHREQNFTDERRNLSACKFAVFGIKIQKLG